jgi:hypothetical protein
MRGLRSRSIAGAIAVTVFLPAVSEARPLVVPFDFSRSVIVLKVSVRGAPLYMFLDTGVNPSAIDTARAESLGLKIDYSGGGEASGQGGAEHVMVYPTSIDDLAIGGRRFGPVEALALDMKGINSAYGRPIDGTRGYSFLDGKRVLIDYAARTVTFFDRKAEVAPQLAKCRMWRMPLRSLQGDKMPIVELKIGSARLPVSIDTGSNGNVELFKKALDEPTIKAALVETGTTTETGNRGAYSAKVYQLKVPISVGPFLLPAGQAVTLSSTEGSAKTRLANVGDKLLASMQLKLLLDYQESRIAFFGDCAKPSRRNH